jgi:hypothetical protein
MELLIPRRLREEAIEKWVLAVVANGVVDRFDDLHLDLIDPAWKHPDHWVEGGLEALRVAIGLRNQNRLPFIVALAFSLKSYAHRQGIDFCTQSEFQERLNWSPPSLYLFHLGEEPKSRVTLGDSVVDLDPTILGIATDDVSCYYLEFLPQDADEYCRSVFIESKVFEGPDAHH